MTRKIIVDQLRDYFAQKGGVMTAEEYKEAEDAPIRFQVLKRKLGPWPRILNMLGEVETISAPVVEPKKVETKKADPKKAPQPASATEQKDV